MVQLIKFVQEIYGLNMSYEWSENLITIVLV